MGLSESDWLAATLAGKHAEIGLYTQRVPYDQHSLFDSTLNRIL